MAFGQDHYEDDGGGLRILTESAVQSGYRVWFGSKNHPTVFRPYPARDLNGQLLPPRGPDGVFTDWICNLKIFKGGVGKTFMTFVCSLPDGPGRIKSATEQGPCELFYSRMKTLVKSPGFADDGVTQFVSWSPLLEGSRGTGAALSRPDVCGFVQGILLKGRGKDFSNTFQQETVRSILQLTRSGRQSLESLVNAEADNYQSQGISKDSPMRYKVGEWLSHQPDANGYVHGRMLILRYYEGKREDGSPVNKYVVELGEDWPLPNSLPLQNWARWEDLIKLHEPDEQVHLLMQAGFTPVMLRTALYDQPYLPDSIRKGLSYNVPTSAPHTVPGMHGYGQPGTSLPATPGYGVMTGAPTHGHPGHPPAYSGPGYGTPGVPNPGQPPVIPAAPGFVPQNTMPPVPGYPMGAPVIASQHGHVMPGPALPTSPPFGPPPAGSGPSGIPQVGQVPGYNAPVQNVAGPGAHPGYGVPQVGSPMPPVAPPVGQHFPVHGAPGGVPTAPGVAPAGYGVPSTPMHPSGAVAAPSGFAFNPNPPPGQPSGVQVSNAAAEAEAAKLRERAVQMGAPPTPGGPPPTGR